MINEPTCYKNPLNPLCIDLLLTENVNSFQKTFVSDFHKLIDAMKKSRMPKEKPNIKCRKCKILLKKKFEKDILNKINVARKHSKLVNLKNCLLVYCTDAFCNKCHNLYNKSDAFSNNCCRSTHFVITVSNCNNTVVFPNKKTDAFCNKF